MEIQNSKALAFSLTCVGGVAAMGQVAQLPVSFAAYILGSSFLAQMQTSILASKAATTFCAKIVLFPWLSAGLFTAASIVIALGFTYLSCKGLCMALDFVRGIIKAGDVKTAKRLAPFVQLLAHLEGPPLTSLAGKNLEMLKFILEIGRESTCLRQNYMYHFALSELPIQQALVRKTIDTELVELILYQTSFESNTNVAALVAVKLKPFELNKAVQAAFVRKLREAKFTEHSPVFVGRYVWVNTKPFIDAGYDEMLFRAALKKKKIPSGRLLFDEYGIDPSDKLFEIALEAPRAEALARDLLRRGCQTKLPFHKTASTALARELHASGKFSINRCDDAGNTPLHAAAALGFEGPFSYYRQLGLDPQAKNARGERPFDLACKHGHLPIVRNLLETGCSFEGPYTTYAWCKAAVSADLDLLKAFEAAGQDIFEEGWGGMTALDLAAENGHHEAAHWLLQRMQEWCTGSLGWVNPRYWKAVEKAAAIARENEHVELSQALIESVRELNPESDAALAQKSLPAVEFPYGLSKSTKRNK